MLKKLLTLEDLINKHRRTLAKKQLSVSLRKTQTYSHKKSNIAKLDNNSSNNRVYKKRNNSPTILKVLGWRKKGDSLKILMNYILQNTNFLENELGEAITDKSISKADENDRFNLIKDIDNKKKYARNCDEENLKNRQLCHTVFSLPNNRVVNERVLHKTLRETLPHIFAGHKYVFGIHTNTSNMHVHIAFKTKNDVTNQQIRLNPQELVKINKILYKACLQNNVNMEKLGLEPIPLKKSKTIDKDKKLPDFILKTAPKWCENYKNNSFLKVDGNIATINKLKELQMNDEQINSFLNLYNEDKKLAIYVINNMPKLFNMTNKQLNDYNKLNNKDGFTLRQVQVKVADTTKTDNIEK